MLYYGNFSWLSRSWKMLSLNKDGYLSDANYYRRQFFSYKLQNFLKKCFSFASYIISPNLVPLLVNILHFKNPKVQLSP